VKRLSGTVTAVIGAAVSDEVGQVAALSGDPVAERTRLIARHPGIRQHRIFHSVNQRAGLRREHLRLSIRKDTVLGGGSLTNTS
jgi:butyrate kinase